MAQPQYTPALSVERLTPFVDASGDCWEWTGRLTPAGYGDLPVKIDGKWCNRRAHRLVWVALVGPIQDGLTPDHLCRVRHCVNPDHLEWVTDRVNILRGYGISAGNARKTACKRGHSDWWIRSNGQRQCRQCKRMRDAERRSQRPGYGTSKNGPVANALKTACIHGHTNWRSRPKGGRQCIDCALRAGRERRAARAGRSAP